MTERLKVHAWKACVRESVPRVQIPLSPPFFYTFLVDIIGRTRRRDSGAL